MLRQYEEYEFSNEENSEKKSVENSVLRRLYRILNMPTTSLPDINLSNQDMQFAFLAFYNKPLAFNLLPHAEHK